MRAAVWKDLTQAKMLHLLAEDWPQQPILPGKVPGEVMAETKAEAEALAPSAAEAEPALAL